MTMDDPKRWSEAGGGATDMERALLRRAREVGPSRRDREAVLAAVLARVGGVGGGQTGGATGPNGAANGATAGKGAGTMAKALLVVVVTGTALWFLFHREHSTPRQAMLESTVVSTAKSASASASAAASVQAPEPVETTVVSAVSPPTPPPTQVVKSASAATPSVAPSIGSNAASFASQLKEENELTTHAREALRAGDYSGALAFLDAAQKKFPNGVLVQERQALEIETLWRSGRKAKAAALANAFLAAYPNSPHAARVREFTQP
jgi:hypothetical protein